MNNALIRSLLIIMD